MDRYERARYEREERVARDGRYERGDYERGDYERGDYERGDRSRLDRGGDAPGPVRRVVPRRVVRNWERLVGAAVRADSEAASQSEWSGDEGEEEDEDDEDGFARMSSGPPKRAAPSLRSASYVVPQSLAAQTDIDAVMEVAEDIRKDDDDVARILFEYAYNLTQQMDPQNRGRGVLQFKSALKSVLMQKRIKEANKHIDRSKDLGRITDYHRAYKEKEDIATLAEDDQAAREGRAPEGENPEYQAWRTEKLRRFYEISNILNKAANFLGATAEPAHFGSSSRDPAKSELNADANKTGEFTKKAYNILPLESAVVNNPFQHFPEVIAATRALYTSEWQQFPQFGEYSTKLGRDVLDIFDFLHCTFCFQKDNVSNQREHLILLLANAESREGTLAEGTALAHNAKLAENTIAKVYNRILANYVRWCEFLKERPQTKLAKNPQLQLCLTALYLLIWGEAANVRFLPECLCYIFHHMAEECFKLLNERKVQRSTRTINVESEDHTEYAFLKQIITPVYTIVAAEAKNSEHGKAPHGSWRNYDDFNEYFWSRSCFDLNWPWNLKKGFFTEPRKKGDKKAHSSQEDSTPLLGSGPREKRVGKTNFVEHRSSLHLYHSFHRLWVFLACMFQVLAVWAFSSENGHLNLHIRTIKKMMSVGPTFAILMLFKSILDFAFMWGALRNTGKQIVTRMLIRLVWLICLSGGITYLYVKTLQEDASNPVSTPWFRIYYLVLCGYVGAQVLFTFILRLPFLRKPVDKCSNVRMCQFIKWMQQERYYVGRDMYERTSDYVKYSLFWIVVLVAKFAFTMNFQIMPMVEPTRFIIDFKNITYKWHSFVSKGNNNIFTLVSLWAPVAMIYVLDVQVWYTVASALLGGLEGAKDKLGEIRSLDMLRKRFLDCPGAFVDNLDPTSSNVTTARQDSRRHELSVDERRAIQTKDDARRFLPIWNAVIKSLREEDLLNNRERSMLEMPLNNDAYPNGKRDTVMCWPLFLLANKLHIAVGLGAENKHDNQTDLWLKVTADEYMNFAIQETFQTLEQLLLTVFKSNDLAYRWIQDIFGDVRERIKDGAFVGEYKLQKLPQVVEIIKDLTQQLGEDDEENVACRSKAKTLLNSLSRIVMRDLKDGKSDRLPQWNHYHAALNNERLFNNMQWPNEEWQTRATRLHNILKVHTFRDEADGKQKTYNTESIPKNLEARRRLQFFTNSLFMNMPKAKPVSKMFSFCVFTPYYSEDVMYDLRKKGGKKGEKSKKDEIKELDRENEDGITILFYLQKIYPDEFKNFLERLKLTEGQFVRQVWETRVDLKEDIKERNEITKLELRLWASYRGQTLARTVRGMMYYKKALELQAELETRTIPDPERGVPSSSRPQRGLSLRSPQAQAELKFVYLVSCQIYGDQKKTKKPQAADILYLMQQNESLRVAYVDEVNGEGGQEKTYYSKLVKVDKVDKSKDQMIYSVKLPGPFKLGEGKPENQNHAIIFSRGDAVQTIDMNQDNYLEEAFKVRNLLEEFDQVHGRNAPTILGVREHVFTGSVSSLAWFMSMQESSFVTLGQRVLARPLKVRMHYGHPDIFDRIFHFTTGGVSKSSAGINLSEDIFAGFNTTLRQGNVTHHEYIQVGKGRDVGLNQIATFEAKVASGNGEQALARDLYRLGQLLDFPRMLSFFFTSVGFYVTTMLTVLTLYAFLYGKAYLALSGVDASLKANNDIMGNAALQSVLTSQFLFQIGIFTAIPMIVNLVLEQGLIRAIMSVCTMQLQLASVFFTFSLGTRTHYFGRIILHGGAKYRSTGRGFVVRHINFAENYRLFSRSHFTKAFEIILLLIIYLAFGAQNRTSITYILLTFSSWFLALSWLYAPYIFNPSGFEWQKTVEDFDDWSNWVLYKGGVGVKADQSWEAWWLEEQDHLKTAGGKFWEFVFSLRFFFFQYGVAYHLNVFQGSTSIMVYVYSWIMLIVCVTIFKVFTHTQKSESQYHLAIRLFQGALFIGLVAGAVVAIVLSPLSFSDCFAVALAIVPTGWGLITIAIIFRGIVESIGLWHSVREIARLYEACMGMIIFIPIALLSWFPFFSTFQTRLVFNQAFSRGLEISLVLAGNRANTST